MLPHIRDPGHVGLRRGIRIAIAMPIVLAITLEVIDDNAGAVFAAFGTVGLLITADYAGTATRRLTAYLVTGAVGVVAIVVGTLAASTLVTAVIVTLIAGFCASMAGAIRGVTAVGAPAVQLIYICAVCVGVRENLGGYLAAWGIAVVVCTLAALVVLPHDANDEVRAYLQSTLAATAALARATWVDAADTASRAQQAKDLDAALATLRGAYDGKPFRSANATPSDRALTLLVARLTSARDILVLMADEQSTARPPNPARSRLAAEAASALEASAAAMTDLRGQPTAADLDRLRQEHLDTDDDWVLHAAQTGTDPAVIVKEIDADHLLRVVALFTEQIVALVREANRVPPETLANEPAIPARSLRTIAQTHLSGNSPWLHLALRAGIGLAFAVLVVRLTGVSHGFWVLLGVIAVLRFDAVGTRRFALLAVVGTVAGVAIGTVIVVAVGPNAAVLWILMAPAVFLAAWAPAATTFPFGQAAFSLFIILVFGIVNWPPELGTGLVRIEDILIGAAVAFAVAFLMWPTGAVGALRREVSAGIRTCMAFVALSLHGLSRPVSSDEMEASLEASRIAADRARETYDLAIMQRATLPEDTPMWSNLTAQTHLLLTLGAIFSRFDTDPALLASQPAVTERLNRDLERFTQRWESIADVVARTDARSVPVLPKPIAVQTESPPSATGIVDAASARAYTIAVWAMNWIDHLAPPVHE